MAHLTVPSYLSRMSHSARTYIKAMARLSPVALLIPLTDLWYKGQAVFIPVFY